MQRVQIPWATTTRSDAPHPLPRAQWTGEMSWWVTQQDDSPSRGFRAYLAHIRVACRAAACGGRVVLRTILSRTGENAIET